MIEYRLSGRNKWFLTNSGSNFKIFQTTYMSGTVFLIPTFLSDQAVQTIPSYVVDAVKQCQVFFVENERTARRHLKQLWREMVIDQYKWFT
ncbi:MAG: hypothetical protein ACR2KZ_11520, partial [Segetibacter sp.]